MTVKTEDAGAGRSGARASGRGPGQTGTVEHLSRADRVARGKDARAVTPLESNAEFSPGPGRDPVGLLLGQAQSRVPELVPVRHGRMLVSPFTFYRGAALPMAADLAGTPASGLRVQLCGDAHLSNFGAFASPERRLVFDVNDFDETLPGPFEWDVKRLAASLAVAGRDSGFPAKARRKIVLAAAERYRTAMRGVQADALYKLLHAVLGKYRRTLQSDRRHLLEEFAMVQVARKVVGVGSVGTRAWVVLMEAADGAEPLFLQAKEAQPSVLAEYCGRSQYNNQGERVVAGQHLMQAQSDIFLGWARVANPIDGADRDFYVRQLKDWKFSVPIELMLPEGMALYARLCGWTLARAHARSGDRIALAAYLGSSGKFDQAIADFAETYADQNERDYAALQAAVKDGRAEATTEI